ncbi:MAG TPA: TonB-dependent receptor, partial [Opitutaceae bacterium]|nr:TonB-dependent receptor [Opitutaceae bacterium]
LDRESLYQGWVSPGKFGQSTIAFDAELDHARSDGTIAYGDSQFYRYAGRLQARDANSQTDLFFGYQSKFFGWRNLYTPFNVNETENLQTSLAIFNHRQNYGAGSYIEAGAFYRRNKDDYEFNRFVPGQFNPYQHTGWVRGTGFDGRHDFEIFQLNYSGELTGDRLKTTSLLFGPYLSRSLFKLTLVPEKTWALEQGAKFQLRAGASYDDSNRAGSAVSPVVEAALSRSGREGSQQRVYASYTQTSQLPTYTALGSNPTSGLFRGNPNLGRAETHNYEFGGSVADGPWKGQAAIFYRRDNQLVDFTFSHLVTAARTANPVNLDTYGVEGFVSRTSKYCDVVLGYTYLDKNPNYGSAMVDASYYALNYARHRATLSLVARPGAGFEVRADNTYRLQAANLLRTTGGNRSLSTTLGVYYTPPPFRALTVFAQADNLWNDGFQEIPATPAARRQWVFGAVYHW